MLFASNESSDEEDECSENPKQETKTSNQEASKSETAKRHTIHVDNSEEQRITQSHPVLEYSNGNTRRIGRRASETSLQVSISYIHIQMTMAN